MPITIEITSYQQDADAIRNIRQAVFVKEQGIDPQLEWDEFDAQASFILAKDDNAGPVGTARFFADGKIGRMAVLAAWRNQGIGKAMLNKIISNATSKGISTLMLSAQESAIPFYEKSGFQRQGEPYFQAGILHQDMVLSLIK